jgi:hypothetical protein
MLMNVDGSAASRPVPNPLHVAAAEKEARQKRAVTHVMFRDNLSHPEAQKKVEAEGGADAVVAKLDAPAPLTADAVRASLRARLAKTPSELLDFVLELNERVLRLEGSPEVEETRNFGDSAITGYASAQPFGAQENYATPDEGNKGFRGTRQTQPKPFGE